MNRYREYGCIYNGRENGGVKEISKGINFSFNTTKLVFRYLHLSKRFKNGEYVKKGDIIGKSGDEGKDAKNTMGPHVHFEVIDNSKNYNTYSLHELINDCRAHIFAFTEVSYPEKLFDNDLLLRCKEVIGNETLLMNKKLLQDIALYYREQVEYLLKKSGKNIQDYLD